MSLDEIEEKVAALRETFAAASADPGAFEACVGQVGRLKQLLTVHRLQNAITNDRFWLICREVYEVGALVSIHRGDVDSFECFYSQLHPFYFDYTQRMERSERMDVILGIRMLHLLTENRIGDFYMLLELIPHDLRNSTNISYVVDLERSMMEGNLARLIDVHRTAPCEYYKTLSDKLADTARSKIAASMEVAYTSLSMDEAARMLNLADSTEMMSFIAYYNQCKAMDEDSPVQWRVDGNRITFISAEATRCGVSSRDMLVHALEDIEELEKIV